MSRVILLLTSEPTIILAISEPFSGSFNENLRRNICTTMTLICLSHTFARQITGPVAVRFNDVAVYKTGETDLSSLGFICSDRIIHFDNH